VRDIVYHGKKTYGEFLASDERIGTSVLANRLASLEASGVLVKVPNTKDKRIMEYGLTQKGKDVVPILESLTVWGATYDPNMGADPRWKLSDREVPISTKNP
jgi:DNA-binding HxlR family transcriptional regulator